MLSRRYASVFAWMGVVIFGPDDVAGRPAFFSFPEPQRPGQTSEVEATRQSPVNIRGGADETGHHYEWTIESNHSSPIVYVEFPHYRADLFTPPKGWALVEMTPDVVSAQADSVEFAIRPGHPAMFKMRIRAAGAARSVGGVRLRYEDGSESIVGGVTIPQPPSDKNIGLIGLGALFVIWVTLRRLRRKRGRESF